MRRAARRDDNEAIIIAALEAAGCSVVRLSAKGVPDLLIGRRGRTFLIEVIGNAKAAKYRSTGGLTPDQVTFRASWRGQWATARTVAEALEAIKAAEIG